MCFSYAFFLPHYLRNVVFKLQVQVHAFDIHVFVSFWQCNLEDGFHVVVTDPALAVSSLLDSRLDAAQGLNIHWAYVLFEEAFEEWLLG